MTHWKKLRNKVYLGSWDFEPNEVKTLTIQSADSEKITGFFGGKMNEEMGVVLRFSDAKPMILNVTNSEAITKALGTPQIEEWVGKRIQAKVEEVRAKGSWTEGIRIIPKPAALPEMHPQHDNWSGAKLAIKEKSATIADVKRKYTLSKENQKLLEGE